MFNSMEIKSSTLSILRCKQCKAMLFRQDYISEYMSYDPNDFGKLIEYAKNKKFEGDADFFVLQSQTTLYSSFKIDYTKSMLTDYHPFFLMHMFHIECEKCSNQLGYHVQTVNENTLWMQGKFLIDASKCSIMKEGKDEMPRLIKLFKSRLVKKLEQVNQVPKEPQVNQQKQIIEKLQRIKIPHRRIHSDHSNRSKNERISRDLKKRTQSVQSTNVNTNFISKVEIPMTNNSLFQSNIFKNDDTFNRSERFETKLFVSNNNQSIAIARNISVDKSIKVQKRKEQNNEQSKNYASVPLTQEQREKIMISLQIWKQKILNESKNLHCKPIIDRIFENMTKIEAHERYVYKKIAVQELELNKAMTLIRKNFLEKAAKNN